MSRAMRMGALGLALASACAPAEPGWSSGHAADPEAPVGAETPVAEVLRDPPPPPPDDASGGHRHHGAAEPSEPTTSEGDHAH